MDYQADKVIRKAAIDWYKGISTADKVVLYRNTKIVIPETGETIRLLSSQNGIWKPSQMSACLSLMTSHKHVYDDYSRDGLFFYKYRSHGGYDHSDNRSLRLAMQHKLPMLYFNGVGVGLYVVEMVVALQEKPDRDGVILSAVPEDAQDYGTNLKVAEMNEPAMRYATYTAQRRLHQTEFRHRIMTAYHSQCAICRLKHTRLLDAAHIIPDSEGGRPETSNGLSLCRIHHSAYDQNILGIDPDYQVHINREMLEETDGPMLKHGFQEMDKQVIHHPRRAEDQPDRDRLSQRYETFLAGM